jgi:hypothetical protein
MLILTVIFAPQHMILKETIHFAPRICLQKLKGSVIKETHKVTEKVRFSTNSRHGTEPNCYCKVGKTRYSFEKPQKRLQPLTSFTKPGKILFTACVTFILASKLQKPIKFTIIALQMHIHAREQLGKSAKNSSNLSTNL